MSDKRVCDATRTRPLGGHDTTASTLTWVLERVSRYPDALTRLESAALDGDDEYLDAVVKEAMRLRPAFPLTARLATEPFELPGLTIPAGTIIAPYITLVNRRPELYPDRSPSAPSDSLTPAPAPTPGSPPAADPDDASAPRSPSPRPESYSRTILRHARLEPTHRRPERVAHRNVFVVPARGGRITLQHRTPHPNHQPQALPRPRGSRLAQFLTTRIQVVVRLAKPGQPPHVASGCRSDSDHTG